MSNESRWGDKVQGLLFLLENTPFFLIPFKSILIALGSTWFDVMVNKLVCQTIFRDFDYS